MDNKTSNRDPIIEEIHQTRRQISDKFNGEITAMLEDAWKRQEASGCAIWQGPSLKRIKSKTKRKSAL